MVKVPILITLLSQLLCTLLKVSAQQSPCPQYFTYITNATTYEVMGRIEIPSPPKNVKLHLKVTLSIAVALPTKYVGKLDLAQSNEESIQRVQQNRPLLYYVYFPLREPLSLVTGIWFNNQKYCSGPSATGRTVTFISLEHTLYPPNALVYMTSSTPPPIGMVSHLPNQSVTIQYPIRKTPHSNILFDEISNPLLNNNECGRSNDINLLISNGMKTSPGQWPWLVALFIDVFTIDFKFKCAGSILTNKHIITAAHCVYFDLEELNFNVLSNVMLISLGRYRLHHWTEEGSLNKEIASYTIHPNFNKYNSDADLAILTLRTPVEFSPTIKPICMWHGSTDLQNVVNKIGFVAGWGNGTPQYVEPRMVKMPIVSQEICLRSNPNFINVTSSRTFCAGLRDGSSSCNGDSGSGLVFYNDTTGRYYLRGIVSPIYNADSICDLNNYIIFVDVAKYLLWIQQQISAT